VTPTELRLRNELRNYRQLVATLNKRLAAAQSQLEAMYRGDVDRTARGPHPVTETSQQNQEAQ
jgi:hypothetical protein